MPGFVTFCSVLAEQTVAKPYHHPCYCDEYDDATYPGDCFSDSLTAMASANCFVEVVMFHINPFFPPPTFAQAPEGAMQLPILINDDDVFITMETFPHLVSHFSVLIFKVFLVSLVRCLSTEYHLIILSLLNDIAFPQAPKALCLLSKDSYPRAPRYSSFPTDLSEFMSAKERVYILPLAYFLNRLSQSFLTRWVPSATIGTKEIAQLPLGRKELRNEKRL